VRETTWTNNLLIFSRCESLEEKEFYLRLTIQEHYNKRELERQISASLFERTMISEKGLPISREKLGPKNVLKDSYVFEFLNLPDAYNERDLHKGLMHQMKKFILEIGKDFVFMGEQYRLQVGKNDFFIDILFYQRDLQCLVAFELKAESFKPEHLGQLNFYLEALDRDVKKPHENPSIGILLCKDKDLEVVEYALSRSLSPALIAKYKTHLPNKKWLQKRLQALFNES
jgi:predicted nuclease of restriction endonuclease-like (RecB) superfamily